MRRKRRGESLSLLSLLSPLSPLSPLSLLLSLSLACLAPDAPVLSVRDWALRAAVVVEGRVETVGAAGTQRARVRVQRVWPVNGGGLEAGRLVTVTCAAVEPGRGYLFFMDPAEEPELFTSASPPLENSEENLRQVEGALCHDCAVAPRLRPLQSQSLVEGERLQLRCDVGEGNPSPTLRWFKDGSELKKNRDVKIKSSKKNSKIQISRVRLEDAGNYSCVAENSLGRDNVTSSVSVRISNSRTFTMSPGYSYTRKCNETEKAYCVNGGDCYFIHGINQLTCECPNDYTGDRCQKSVMADFYRHLGFEIKEAEELYQKRVLTITGICVALLVVGIVCVVAYCKTKKQRKKMQQHMQRNTCAEPNRVLANGPNHPGLCLEEVPMVDYVSKNVPATERGVRHGTETSGNFSGSRMSSRSHHSSTVSHASSNCHEEHSWCMQRSDSMNSDCQSGALSSSVGTSKCSSPACIEARTRRANAHYFLDEPLAYGDSYDSLPDSPHSDRYVSALTTPARLSPVDFHYPLPTQVPTFQITTPNAGHALSLPPAAAASYCPDDGQPLLHRYRRPRRPFYSTESTGSLPSSPYRLVDEDAYETTQEYATPHDGPARSSRRWRRRRLNGHVSQRALGLRDYSSQSEWDEDEEGLGHGESTPFLSMQNMSAAETPPVSRGNAHRTPLKTTPTKH